MKKKSTRYLVAALLLSQCLVWACGPSQFVGKNKSATSVQASQPPQTSADLKPSQDPNHLPQGGPNASPMVSPSALPYTAPTMSPSPMPSDPSIENSMNEPAAKSCTLPWGEALAHGASIVAFEKTSVPCKNTCGSEMRTCDNGTLSGSFGSKTCSGESCCVPNIGQVCGTKPITYCTHACNLVCGGCTGGGVQADGPLNNWKCLSSGFNHVSCSPTDNLHFDCDGTCK